MPWSPVLFTTATGSPWWRYAASRLGLHAFVHLPTPPAAVCTSASPETLPTGVETPAIDILIAMLSRHMGREPA